MKKQLKEEISRIKGMMKTMNEGSWGPDDNWEESDDLLKKKWNDVTRRPLLHYGSKEKKENLSPEIKISILKYTPQSGNWRVERWKEDIHKLHLSFGDDTPLYEVVIYFKFLKNGKPLSKGIVIGYTSENENFLFEDGDEMIGDYLINKFNDEDYDTMGSELGFERNF
jgi:hypothetical protein